MTLQHFNSLSKDNQYIVIYEEGVLLAHRNETRFHFILYQINNFYIEIRYDLDLNEIDGIKTFSDTIHLDPYLDNIPIPDYY